MSAAEGKLEKRPDGTASLPGEGVGAVPAWYPGWARAFAEQYYAGTTDLFVLHGNVHDLTSQGEAASAGYGSLPEFLATQVFGGWDLVLRHDLSQGLRPYAGSSPERYRAMLALVTERLGDPKTWPKDPDAVLALLDRLIQDILLQDKPEKRPSLGVIFEHAQYLVPAGDLNQLAGPLGSRLVRLLGWAQNPYIKRSNIAFCLLADQLSEVNDRLVSSSHVSAIELPMPAATERERFLAWADRTGAVDKITDFDRKQLTNLTGGLSLVSVERLVAQAQQSGQKLDSTTLKGLKKGLIERQARGLVEFVEPNKTLDDFVGNEAIKKRLLQDAKFLTQGRFDAAPMGYLICGPVGTGKTYLAECFSGSVGVPCVKLRNFRSKYVGETEGNLEQILTVLRALGPVVVVVDEADAALGDRNNSGDSGTSNRVFSMIATQMGDTRYRGKLIWMLMTSRPDQLPIDLKRQGRAEVHLPLFAPRDDAEVRVMFEVMARKNKAGLDPTALPDGIASRGLSGADIESIVLDAKRIALADGRETLTRPDLESALADFIPSAQGLEKEMQEVAAVLECTSVSFLPQDWREKVTASDGRARLQERMTAIRRTLED